MKRLPQLLLPGLFALASHASAAPMGFKNSWMIMGDFSKTYQEFALNYATTANDAFGFSASAMQTDNSVSKQQNAEAVYTRTLARWLWPLQVFRWIMKPLGFILWRRPGCMPQKVQPAISPLRDWVRHSMKWTMTSLNHGW